ncbi:hypothetical protein VaNZ11_001154 [Volvox africanus]|uniref:Uncharacterized protein n=1 Tax=Volvox africanus TaxID=51714 RepID=A0ABQ5RQB9_9CHLO|nr:hypothetical protein VaNZ11_001154 [Volvox africanus]
MLERYIALRRMLSSLITLAIMIATAVESCPTPPAVLHSVIIAACSTEPARSAIGCSMYRFCGNGTLQPAIFPQLCTTWNIASSLCNDDANIASSLALCNQLRGPYTDDAQFRSCLPPYPINSTSAIKALHLHACDEMEGYPGDPMAGCDTCTVVSCPDPLASLSAGCIDMPMGQCDGLDALCALGASVLCKKNLKDAPMRPPSPPPEPLATVVSTPPPLLAKFPSPSIVAPSPPPDQAPESAMTPPAMTSASCVTDSSSTLCASYEYPLANITSDLNSLCTSMAYMPGCTIRAACQAGNVTGDFCRPMTLLATICLDMPNMSGCKSYIALCKNTSVVQQCRSFSDIPGLPTTAQARLAVVSGLCAANRTAMTLAVQNLTTAMCAACNQLSCRDYLTPLSSICSISPGLNGCSTYQNWCSNSTDWEAADGSSISLFCMQTSPPLPTTSPPSSITCVTDSSSTLCASYEYPLANITSDLNSLCTSMAYMPGCTIRAACQAGNVTGDFCRPMTLLATICLDMPNMSGCKSYIALCKNTSVVQQCRSFSDIPGLPTTTQARLAVVTGLCAANRTTMSPAVQNLTTAMCAACNQLSCRDYLTPLSSICSISPGLNGCSTYQNWCSNSTDWEAADGSSISLFCMQTSPPLPTTSPPSSITCVTDSSSTLCASYEYPLANITSDLNSLCTSMAYMPGCTIRAACQAGNVTGDFCRPMTLLATICLDMPGMSGCKSYIALCKNTSVVQQCRSFSDIPGLPTTAQARLAVVTGLCAANRTTMTPAVQSLTTAMCAACNQLSCRDYLTPLSSICSISLGLNGCGTYYSWCQNSAAWEMAAGSSISSFCKKQPPPPLPSSPRLPPPQPSTPPPARSPLLPPPKSPPPTVSPPAKSPPPTVSPPSKTPPPTASPPLKTPAPTASPPLKTPAPTASPPARLPPPTASPPAKTPPPTTSPPAKSTPPSVLPPTKTPLPTASPPAKSPPQGSKAPPLQPPKAFSPPPQIKAPSPPPQLKRLRLRRHH